MEQMIKVELPTDEWQKMERNHEIIEEYEMHVEIFGEGQALTLLHKELKNRPAATGRKENHM